MELHGTECTSVTDDTCDLAVSNLADVCAQLLRARKRSTIHSSESCRASDQNAAFPTARCDV
eukprot:51497-Chlamydomonas_euryale.AAC.11